MLAVSSLRKKAFWFSLLSIVLSTGLAQSRLDSLYAVWNDDSLMDSTRIDALSDFIYDGYLLSQPDSARFFADQMLKFSKARKNYWGMGKALILQGQSYSVQSNYAKALEAYMESSGYCEMANDRLGQAVVMGSIGTIHQIQDDYVSAFKYQSECLKIFQELGNAYNISAALNNIGVLFYDKGVYDKALEYFSRSLKYADDENPLLGLSIINIGSIYSDMGDHEKAIQNFKKGLESSQKTNDQLLKARCLSFIGGEYRFLKQYDSALTYLNESLEISERLNNYRASGIALSKIGQLYLELKAYPKAIDAFEKSIQMHKADGDGSSMVMSMIPLGKSHYEQEDYAHAISVCKSALEEAEKLQLVAEQKLACSCLYKVYKNIGNSPKALEYHEQMLVLQDSSKILEMDKKLQKMEFAKQIMKDSLLQVEKDLEVEMAHQAEVRKKDRNRNLAIGAGVFFLALSGGFYSRWRYVKKSKELIEKEKDRSENLLLNILPSEIAEELKLKGKVDAQDFDLVSVLFTDFKGFTTRSEKMSARELVQEINHCFRAFDHICEKYDIEKIKTIGDAYMAGGGLPVPTRDSVKNTVLAALEMQSFIRERINDKNSQNQESFEMRVGIHTGPVVAGIVGVKKFQYDIWGDTVNTAARMESSGEVGKVNISESTYNLIKDDPQFTFVSRGKVNAKGKGEIEMFFVSLS